MHHVWFVLIGLAAGWLAGVIMKGKSYGLAGNLIVGVLGAVLGGELFGVIGLGGGGLLGKLATATVGAVLLIVLVRWAKDKV